MINVIVSNIEFTSTKPVYAIVTFNAGRKYEFSLAGDIPIVVSASKLIMSWDSTYDDACWRVIKQEAKWCEDHFEDLKHMVK